MLKEVTFEIEKLKKEINRYVPFNEQEKRDKQIILEILENEDNVLTRENQKYHFTVSAWIVTPDRKKVLMCYHNIYNSWAWLGGHTDENSDLDWIAVEKISIKSSEKWFVENIYSKLNTKVEIYQSKNII